jgi:hypothetical protein
MDGNSGIEGLTFDDDGHMLVAKEKDPARVIVLDHDGTELDRRKLEFALDLSALTWNPGDDHLYALSDGSTNCGASTPTSTRSSWGAVSHLKSRSRRYPLRGERRRAAVRLRARLNTAFEASTRTVELVATPSRAHRDPPRLSSSSTPRPRSRRLFALTSSACGSKACRCSASYAELLWRIAVRAGTRPRGGSPVTSVRGRRRMLAPLRAPPCATSA